MSVFANIVNLFPGMSWLSLPEEVQVFGQMMNQQLDLRVEGSNLERFERNFAGRGARVVFPRPIRLGGDTEQSREVLMEEFEDALPLKYFLKNGGGPYDDRIASIGLDAFLVSPPSVKADDRKCYYSTIGPMATCTQETLWSDSTNLHLQIYLPPSYHAFQNPKNKTSRKYRNTPNRLMRSCIPYRSLLTMRING